MERQVDQPAIFRPALLAVALSPTLAVLMTATAPPRTFLDPLPLLFLLLLHGCGVLVAHELALAWRRGWCGILLLGVAFGIVVEGFVSRSLFTTEWLKIGLLGDFGHWLHLNWHWSLLLLVFHAVVSIALPILVAELVWPSCRGERWLDPAATQLAVMGLLAATVYGSQSGWPAEEGSTWTGAAMLFVVVLLARRVRLQPRPPRRMRPPWRIALGAAGGMTFWLLAQTVLPELGISALVSFLVLLGLTILMAWRWSIAAAGFTERHRLAVLGGVLLPWIALSGAMAADAGRVEDATGQGWVGLALLLGWFWLRRRVADREAGAAGAGCYTTGGGTYDVGSAG